MKNKGFTTVELIVSFTLVTVITILLFQLIFVLKDLYVYSGMKIKLLTKSAKMSIPINDDIATKNLISAQKLSNSSISFCFADNSCKTLSFDRQNKTFSYGDLTQNLVSGSEFGNIFIRTETFISTYDNETLNSILTIKIPVYTTLIEGEDFGVNITYLYNSNAKSLSGLNITDIVTSPSSLQLLGNEEDYAFKDVTYIDPGYASVGNDYHVEVSGAVNTSRIGNYYLTYTLYDKYNNLIAQKVRTVSVIDSQDTYVYTGQKETKTISVPGRYLVQLWGASGGGSDSMSGKGGYTEGYFDFDIGDELYIYVGGKGTLSTNGASAQGGFNGGGSSGTSTSNFAGSGGGATDIRLNTDNLAHRILIAGGGGGAGSVNDSVYYCFGGHGGGTEGISCDKCDVYSGGSGTSSSGGLISSYTGTGLTVATNGALGIGGNGSSYTSGSNTYSGGGGGGGYYGGAGGTRYGGGGAGSGYCGTSESCTTLDGTNLIQKPGTNKYEKGHIGDGYAVIKLISTIVE